MKRALFIGDICVDIMMGGMESLPIVDREITCKSFEVTLGGSTVLCACAFVALGGSASFLGLTGNDDYGDFSIRGMQSFGINTDLVRRTNEVKTGVTLNLIYANTRTQVTYPGTIAEFSGADLEASLLDGFHHIHFSGPYLETKLIPHITRILKTAREAGISTSLDPQWDSKQTWEYMNEWLPLLTYFFSNSDEAVSITNAFSAEEALKRLALRTPLPLVKTGSEGALVLVDGVVKTIASKKVEVVDTTGAGDSFDAGFLYATLEKKMDLTLAVEFANLVAARSCKFIGGVNARSSYEDILKFKEE